MTRERGRCGAPVEPKKHLVGTQSNYVTLTPRLSQSASSSFHHHCAVTVVEGRSIIRWRWRWLWLFVITREWNSRLSTGRLSAAPLSTVARWRAHHAKWNQPPSTASSVRYTRSIGLACWWAFLEDVVNEVWRIFVLLWWMNEENVLEVGCIIPDASLRRGTSS